MRAIRIIPRPDTPSCFFGQPANETRPAFSPDGRWVAYLSNETGANEVYVRASASSPGAAGKWQISSAGGGTPIWSRNGRELFYLRGQPDHGCGLHRNGSSLRRASPGYGRTSGCSRPHSPTSTWRLTASSSRSCRTRRRAGRGPRDDAAELLRRAASPTPLEEIAHIPGNRDPRRWLSESRCGD